MPFLMIGLAVLFAAVDQILKLLVVQFLKPVGTVALIPGLLNLTYVENRGAAFGMLSNQRWLFIVLTCLLMLVVFFLLFRYQNHTILTFLACGLILGGGVGNLIDRIWMGYVVDYISVSFFPPVFNFADCAVVIGTALFVIHVIFFAERAGVEHVERRRR